MFHRTTLTLFSESGYPERIERDSPRDVELHPIAQGTRQHRKLIWARLARYPRLQLASAPSSLFRLQLPGQLFANRSATRMPRRMFHVRFTSISNSVDVISAYFMRSNADPRPSSGTAEREVILDPIRSVRA